MSPLRAAGFAARLRREARTATSERAAVLNRMASACQNKAVLPW